MVCRKIHWPALNKPRPTHPYAVGVDFTVMGIDLRLFCQWSFLAKSCRLLSLLPYALHPSLPSTHRKLNNVAMSDASKKHLDPMRDWEAFVERQVQEQTAQHSYPLRRSLDFSPFQSALQDLEPTALQALQALTQTSTIPMLQAQMAAGALSSQALTLFYLAQIQRHNQHLGAYLELNPKALEEARGLDAERQAGKLRGPLHGIPICIKDNISMAGLHNTAGAAVLAEFIPNRDAFIAQKLRAAGAVILGKNNLSEWANFMTSTSVNGFSALGGHTRNPYGPFDVGGSSSGTASAVAANLAVAGIGSETSGSLIYPAAQNSVFTLKPSLGLVSRSRIIPISDAQDTAGPLCKNATDLTILMSIISGYDSSDALTALAKDPKVAEFAQPSKTPVKNLRVGFIRHDQRKGDLEIMDKVAQTLQGLGAEVLEVPMPQDSIDMLPVLRYGLREGVNAYLKAAAASVDNLAAVIAHNQAHPQAAPYGQDLLVASQEEPMTAEQYQALVDKNCQIGTLALDTLFSEHKVQILLVVSNALSSPTSTSGYPVVNFPAGYRASGEPVGASLVGRLLEDATLIGLAEQISSQLNIHRPPKL